MSALILPAAPDWLARDKVYQMLGHKQRYKGYRDYVEQGLDEDIKRFYSKGNILGVLGDKEYRRARKEEFDETDIIALRAALQDRPPIEEMMKLICDLTQERKSELLTRIHGRQYKTTNRAFAMYACHHYCQATHQLIANYFGLKHAGSVCYSLRKVKRNC